MRRELVFLLLIGILGGCAHEPSPSPVVRQNPQPGTPLGICVPATSAVTLDGVVSERIAGTVHPVAGAAIELFMFSRASSAGSPPQLVGQAVTGDNGRYRACFPMDAVDASGVMPSGQKWEVRARKDGYLTATQVFEFSYGFWDYGGMTVNLELVR